MSRHRNLWIVFLLVFIAFSLPNFPLSSPSDAIERNGVYVAYANGIVKDTKSGLEWKAGPDKDTNWNEARSWVQSLDLDGGGWRLPTLGELEGLYKNGAGDRKVHLLKASGHFVWSDKTEDSHGGAWFFEFFSGNRDWLYPDSSRFFCHSDRRSYGGRAFAVRSQQKSQNQKAEVAGSPKNPSYSLPSSTSSMTERSGLFEIYANGIVKDTKSGLEWKTGPDKDTNWNEAKSWVQSLDLDGGRWRLPTLAELEGIYRKGAGDRKVHLLKTSEHFVWSDKTEDPHGGVWFFEFFSGNQDWLYPNSRRFFRPGDRRSYGGRAFAVRSQNHSRFNLPMCHGYSCLFLDAQKNFPYSPSKKLQYYQTK